MLTQCVRGGGSPESPEPFRKVQKACLIFHFRLGKIVATLEVATLTTLDLRSAVHLVFHPTFVTRNNDPVCMHASSQEVWTVA